MEFKIVWNKFRILSRFGSYRVALNLSCILKLRVLSCSLGVTKRDVFWGLPNMYPESYDCGLPVGGGGGGGGGGDSLVSALCSWSQVFAFQHYRKLLPPSPALPPTLVTNPSSFPSATLAPSSLLPRPPFNPPQPFRTSPTPLQNCPRPSVNAPNQRPVMV